MLKAKNIIYGYCTYTTPNKPKYLISLYRSDTLNIVAVFPTSRKRSGVLLTQHGCNRKDNVPLGNLPINIISSNLAKGPWIFCDIRGPFLLVLFTNETEKRGFHTFSVDKQMDW